MKFHLTKEVWEDVVDYEGYYQVSNKGEVKSVRYEKKVTLRQNLKKEGYKVVILSVDGEKKSVYVHRLVGGAFIPNLKEKEQINHINGVKHDNRVENLEWATPKENAIHAWKNLDLDNYNAIPLKCLTLGIETISVSEMSRVLKERGYAKGCSRNNLHRRMGEKDRFEYKGLMFEVMV